MHTITKREAELAHRIIKGKGSPIDWFELKQLLAREIKPRLIPKV